MTLGNTAEDATFFRILSEGDEAADPNLIQAQINQMFFPPSDQHNVHNILTFTIGQDTTPLHAAAKGNRGEMIALLTQCGLSPDVRGGYDQATPVAFSGVERLQRIGLCSAGSRRQHRSEVGKTAQ